MGNEERGSKYQERGGKRWEEGEDERKKTLEDDRKTGDLSINYNATATRESQRNRLQQRSHGDMRECRVEQTPREKSEGYGDLHIDRFERKRDWTEKFAHKKTNNEAGLRE